MSRVQYSCTQRKEVGVTENEIRARNAIVLAARNSGEQDAKVVCSGRTEDDR